jgi:large repetitive protein
VGIARIQAIFNGSTNDQSSVSSILLQKVGRLATVTTLSLSSQINASGQIRYFLVATTTTSGTTIVPSGTVVFHKDGRVLGSAKLKNGTAVLRLSARAARSGRFVAKFLGGPHFLASTSAPLSPGDV